MSKYHSKVFRPFSPDGILRVEDLLLGNYQPGPDESARRKLCSGAVKERTGDVCVIDQGRGRGRCEVVWHAGDDRT